MYLQTRYANEIPALNVQKQETYPSQFIVKLLYQDKKAKLKLTKDALKLLEHIEIVKEARKLYSEGKIITWEEFIKNEPR